MKRRIFLHTMMLAAGATLTPGAWAQTAKDETGELLVCGGPQVLRLTVRFTGGGAQLVSRTQWQADQSAGMPPAMVPRFKTTDDCKPIDEGRRVLVTSSGGAVAIFDAASGKTEFHAIVPNAHSADVLPGNRVVAAASDAPEGDKLMVFDRAAVPGGAGEATPICSVPLDSGHGAVWIEAERTLWALGRWELQAYELADWSSAKPSLKLRESFTLPSDGGHDLSPIPHGSSFIVTTNSEVLTFDRRAKTFAPYAPIAKHPAVKSVAIHPATRRVVFIQADKPEWWSRTIRFLDSEATLLFPEDRLYKARWAR